MRFTYAGRKNPEPRDASGGPIDRGGSVSLVLHHSIIHLPEPPMKARLWDSRVGFGNVARVNFGADRHEVTTQRFIRRWRLEKKDPAAAVSDPVKPIVIYIGRGVPEKLRPWIKQGIEAWQAPLEKAGFSHAIVARDAPRPEEEPDWDPSDARYSVVNWLPNETGNAQSGTVSDPRTGEILVNNLGYSHGAITWFVVRYFRTVAAVDPRLTQLPFPDSLMGALVRYLTMHEVGHSLGLRHNMKASSAYPVEKLRDPEFTRVYGNVASVMDYGHFNYVAQPGDGARLIPILGPYDSFAMEWGYKPVPGANTPEEEREALDLIASRQLKDPLLRWGDLSDVDPSARRYDHGDDPTAATRYGLRNIDRIVPMIVPAAKSLRNELFVHAPDAARGAGAPGAQDNTMLEILYRNVIVQRNIELMHVAALIGGVVTTNLVYGQEGRTFTPVPGPAQKNALLFLGENAFRTPRVLLDPEILKLVDPVDAAERIQAGMREPLDYVLSEPVLARVARIEGTTSPGDHAYPVAELLEDLRTGLWAELMRGEREIDPYRRGLQEAHVGILTQKLRSTSAIGYLAQRELKEIARLIDANIGKVTDPASRAHLEGVRIALEGARNPGT